MQTRGRPRLLVDPRSVNVEFEAETLADLAEVSRQDDRSRGAVIRLAVKEFLQRRKGRACRTK